MPSVKELTRSFAGGEITPEMYGRLDNVKFQTGLALCRNAIVLPHGPVTKRAGFGFANVAGHATYTPRLISFAFSASQTMVLEFGHLYIRFHTQGGTLLEANKNITNVSQANPGVVTSLAHGYANGDWVYISGVGGMTRLNGRYFKVANVTTNTFTLLDTTTSDNINTTTFAAYTSGGTTARVYQIASPYDFSVAGFSIFDLEYTQSNDVVTLTHPSYAPRELRRLGGTNWTLTQPVLGNALTLPGTPTVVATAGTGTASNKGFYYKITTISADGTEESLPTTNSSVANNDLTLPGAKNTVSWTTAGSGVTYRVYKAVNGSGRLYGFIAETSDLSFVDDNITPDYSKNPPAATLRLDTSGNYPACATYFEQRRMFAGTSSNPQTVYGTRSATESNLNTSLPSNAADALSFTIKAQQQNAIKHLVPMNDLLALTVGGVWKIGANNNQALAPATLSVRPQNYYGSNSVHPLVTGNSVLYVETNGRRVRDISFQWQAQVYAADDRSIIAPHLFQGYTITDAAYSRSPDQVAWFVRSDGVLLGMSYVPEHQVFGWHQHVTTGLFKSICVVTENNEDVLYAVVERTLNGATVRTIERMGTRFFTTQSDAFFIDCGASYIGAAGTFTMSGAPTVPIVMDAAHGLTTGQTKLVRFYDINGNALTGYDAEYVVTVVSSTIFTIPLSTATVMTGRVRVGVSTISGLDYLEGKAVMALSDGAVVQNLTVTNGAITLPSQAVKVNVGLPYTTDIQTLPMSIESAMAGGQGTTKSVDYAYLRVNRTGIVKVGPSSDRLTTIPPRTNENWDTPPRLRSEILDLLVNPDISQDAQLWVQSADPTPLTVSAITMKVMVGGG